MSLAAERAYFDGDHCQHVAARDEHKRLERLSPRRLYRPRHETPVEQAERYGRETFGEVA